MHKPTNRAYYKQNRLQQLRGFCYAVQTDSISKAAERMSLSQPSVSLQIRALEKELDAVLFERRGPRIRPTPEGLMLYDIALPLVEGFDELTDTFNAQRSSLDAGHVVIAAGESTIMYLLPDTVERFAIDYPAIQVQFDNGPGLQGLQRLRDDQVDFAVGSFRGEPPDDISYHPIYSFDQVLIAPPDHPLAQRSPAQITLADISPYKFILPPRHLNTFSMVEVAFQQQNLGLNVCLEAGGWEVIKQYVQRGVGISIVSGICLRPGDRLFRCPLQRDFPKRTYGVLMRRGKFLSPQAKRFIEYIDPAFFTRHPRP